MSDRLKGYKWEFNLVEDKAINAWCMPGGKVVVYTGIYLLQKVRKAWQLLWDMKSRMRCKTW